MTRLLHESAVLGRRSVDKVLLSTNIAIGGGGGGICNTWTGGGGAGARRRQFVIPDTYSLFSHRVQRLEFHY